MHLQSWRPAERCTGAGRFRALQKQVFKPLDAKAEPCRREGGHMLGQGGPAANELDAGHLDPLDEHPKYQKARTFDAHSEVAVEVLDL